ncbi:MAG: hypothetical protein HY716_17000 [Planctomycetes bacterium]|nr:hypothetical protein [Planctomycetota bacterium]
MPVLAGIDEVGYGPKLGPLAVGATAFRVSERSIDLWRALSEIVSTRPDPDRLPVADSKKLFTQASGIGTLEPTALSFLSMLPNLPGRSFRELLDRVTLEGPDWKAEAPWYETGDLPLPQATEMERLNRWTPALWTALQRAVARPIGVWIAWSEPRAFNRAVSNGCNKSDYLFAQSCRLVRAVLNAGPGEDVIVRIGKHGGRRMYLAGLVREFGHVWVLQETARTSRYEFREGGRRILLEFLMDGEERDFSIALSSMIGKYLREGAMRLFNEWWMRRAEPTQRTAGYGADAWRFYREIEPHFVKLGLRPDSVLRTR